MSSNAVGGGSVDAEGFLKFLLHFFKLGYTRALNVTQRAAGANMSVDVNIDSDGYGGALFATASAVPYFGYTNAAINSVVSTADPTNPRKDIVVAYIDLSLITTGTTNNLGAFKIKVVAGTAAASPVDPSGATIQASVGAGNPYVQLARVTLTAALASITNAVITDLRTPSALAMPYLWGGASNTKGHLVPNVADDTLALQAATQTLSGKTLASPVITSPVISGIGASGSGVWWEELSRANLGVAGNTITVNLATPRKYLHIISATYSTGGTIVPVMRFNNDSAANYSERYSDQGAADSAATSTTLLTARGGGAIAGIRLFNAHVINIATQEKLTSWQGVDSVAGAATAPSRIEGGGKWANTTAQITRVDIINSGGTGNFAIGSEVIVLGHD